MAFCEAKELHRPIVFLRPLGLRLEAQRVNLARAMIIEPEILFLDEPFSALDFPTKIKLMEDFKEVIGRTGTTAVFVSHDLMEINYLTKRLAIIVDGELKQIGPTREVLDHPNGDTASFLNEWKKFYPLSGAGSLV